MPLLIPTCLLLLVLMSSGNVGVVGMMEDNGGNVAHVHVNQGCVGGGSSIMVKLP